MGLTAIRAVSLGYDAYGAVDASGTFSLTKRETGLLRLTQAGVIVTDYATTMVEILKDNASPLANDVYAALDMPFSTLVGQIFAANTKRPRDAGLRRAENRQSEAAYPSWAPDPAGARPLSIPQRAASEGRRGPPLGARWGVRFPAQLNSPRNARSSTAGSSASDAVPKPQ